MGARLLAYIVLPGQVRNDSMDTVILDLEVLH
jgi:hypothetical protein